MALRGGRNLGVGSGALSLRRASVACAIGAACAESPPHVEAMEPARGLNDRATQVVIIGRDLDPPILEDGARVRAGAWSGEVGGRPLDALRWISPERMTAVVPPGLSPGSHDLRLRADSREAVLPYAFTSVAPVAPRLDGANPSRLPAQGGTVRVSGVGLHLGSVVRMGDAGAGGALFEVPSTWIHDEELELTAPARAAGPVRIEVETPVGAVWRDGLVTYESS